MRASYLRLKLKMSDDKQATVKKRSIEILLDFLKIIFSWPFVVLIIFGSLNEPIRDLIKSVKLSRISVPGGEFIFEPVPSEIIGKVDPRVEPQEAIKELLTRPQQVAQGLVEVFSGRNRIVRGSGFVVSEDGLVISDTNVIGDSETVFVRLFGKDEIIEAEVIDKNPPKMLALLKLPEGLYPKLEMTPKVKINEKVYKASIRSNFLEGVVKTIGQSITIYISSTDSVVLEDVIITSAISEPGDSGAPVLNQSDRVIGVVVGGSREKTILVSTTQIFSAFPKIFSKTSKKVNNFLRI